jgi:hypothetical protein
MPKRPEPAPSTHEHAVTLTVQRDGKTQNVDATAGDVSTRAER